ncbi:MAG: dockerin type I repeat-containing protein, partial [Ruminococcus callidus]|nr:dockerin type I repeat-containing protein [Ruminococcus callidus]
GDEAYQAAKVAFVSDSDANFVESTDGTGKVSRNIIFKNLSDQTSDDNKVEESVFNSTVMVTKSGIQYKMPYATPFCLGSIDKVRKGYYVYSASKVSTNRYAVPMNSDKINEYGNLRDEEDWNIGDPLTSCSSMMSDGNGGVYFTISEKESANSNYVEKTLSTADGSLKMEKLKSSGVVFRYSYIDQKTFEKKDGSVKYPYFDPTLPKDQPLTGDSDKWLWVDGSKSVKVLGEKDEFSLCEVDAVIKQGTAAGDYTISLDQKETYLSAVDDNGENFSRSAENGKLATTKAVIHVVNDSAPETTTTMTKPTTTTTIATITPASTTKTESTTTTIPTSTTKTESTTTTTSTTKIELTTTTTTTPIINPTAITTKVTTTITELKKVKLGNINDDDVIDSKDAVLLLKSYAESLVSGKKSTDLTGDINNDGSVDSKDAVIILKYYAATLTGFTGTISEFK